MVGCVSSELLGEERAIENGHLLYMLRRIGDKFTPPTVTVE